MPSEDMEQRRQSSMHVPLSFSSEKSILCTEEKDGFWRNELLPDQHGKEGMPFNSASKYALSTHLDTFFKEKNAKLGLEYLMGSERTANSSMMPWNAINHDLTQHYDLFGKGNKADLNGVLHENGLFSSSLPNIFNRKLTFSASGALPDLENDAIKSTLDDESFKSLEEIEAQTIGNLLPDDDELLSGVHDGKEYAAQLNNNDDMEDDIFCSLGGMELEINDDTCYHRSSNILKSKVENGLQNNLNNEDSSGHPSRNLFVGNIDINIDDADLKVLFEHYGDIHSIHMASKHQGYIIISYYDIRSANNAKRALQNKSIMNKKLDIHYSSPKEYLTENDADQAAVIVFNIDPSVSNEALHQIFRVYGGVKEIRQTHSHQHRYIEFYDIRDAQAAVQALKRTNTFGKQVRLESSFSWDKKECSLQQSPLELGKETLKESCQQDNTLCNLSSQLCGKFPIKEVISNGPKNGVIGPFIDASLPDISSSFPHFSSPGRDAFVGSNNNNQSKICELSNSTGQTKFGLQCIPNLHHALPEYHNNLANGVLYNSPNSLSAMALNIGRHTELIDEKHMHRMNLAGLSNQPFEHVEGNGGCTLHGHQYAPNSSNAYLRPSGHVMWPTSPPFVNNVPLHSQFELHGIPRAPSQMLNTVLPFHHHLVGSAPTMNPSLWDRVNSYTGDSIDVSAFQPGSLGSMGFSANSMLHPLEVASQNIFARCNYMEPSVSSAHGRLTSPQQRSHMFHVRNPIGGTPPTFDPPIDRNRNRRNDASSNQTDNKKQFELDIERIERGEDSRTTLMIKNIPNKYTSKMLLATIDELHRGTYDFIYLPIDFKNKCNVGYAFINMIDSQQIVPFYKAFNGKKWEKFNSEKVASLAYARIQGKAALIAHFQNSSLMNEDKRCRPILFHTDGPNAGDQEPFPIGVNIRSRSGRPKSHSNEDSHIGSSSNSCITGETSKDINSSSDSVK